MGETRSCKAMIASRDEVGSVNRPAADWLGARNESARLHDSDGEMPVSLHPAASTTIFCWA